jgi:AcrR family transcriptional regulator
MSSKTVTVPGKGASGRGKAPARTAPEGSPRERLLAAAHELFYGEGIHTVGIDRVIERAGVAKASLYSAFGSKDELVRAYLIDRFDARQRRVAQHLERHHDPRERLLAVFDALAERIAEPDFHGCAFVRACAETSASKPVRSVCEDARSWMRGVFVDLCRATGVAAPEALAQQLGLLYDGAVVAAQMDHDLDAATSARDTAAALLDAALARKTRRA